MAEAILRVAHVSKSYPGTAGSGETVVLRDVNMEVARGESVAVVGPSGSGKSTLLQIIGTLETPTSGEVWLGGEKVSGLSEGDLALVRNRRIGFVFQGHHLLPQCTVLENVLIPALAHAKRVPAQTEERARALIDRVGLAGRAQYRASQLSGGERQRAAVVRALINCPDLLLADEPTGSLDQGNAAELGRLLSELNREQGLAMVVVTHSADLAAGMSRVYQISGGDLQPGRA